MRGVFKKLVLMYLLFVLVKLFLVSFIPAPSALSDDYTYAKMAQSFYDNISFSVHNIPSHQYPPLYPMFLSFSYLFDDMRSVYFVMKLINVLISSLIIFPVFLLAKNFLSEKNSFVVSFLVSALPSNFAFSGYVMAENLFYPLFMFAIYFIYRSFTVKSCSWDMLAGLFAGLSFLARTLGLVLLPVIFLLFLYRVFQKKNILFFRKLMLIFLVFMLIISPWLLRNGLLFGFSVPGVLGGYSSEFSGGRVSENFSAFFPLITWSFVYIGYIALASGVVLFIFSFIVFKHLNDDKLRFFYLLILATIILSVFVVANHSSSGNKADVIYPTIFSWLTGRVMGRYIDHVLPLVIIAGFVGLQLYRKKDSLLFYSSLTTLFLFFASQLVFFPLFPVNNMSLTYLGMFSYGFDFLVYHVLTFNPIFSLYPLLFFIPLFLFLPFLLTAFFHLLKPRRFFLLLAIFFLLSSILVFSVNYYNSDRYWYKGNQMQFGLWVNDNIKDHSTFLFDEDDNCKIEKANQNCIYEGSPDGSSASIMGFWMNHDIIVDDVSKLDGVDYVVTKKKLGLPLVYTKNEIYLYRVVR